MARHGGFARGTKQRKHWHSITPARVDFATNGTAILGQFSGNVDPFTFLRGLGEILVAPTGNGTFAAQDAARLTIGLAIITADAAALGLTAVPDPDDEPDYDWLWWYSTTVQFEGSADAPGQEIALTNRIRLETKAMRKVKPQMAVVMIGQYVDVNGAPPMSVSATMRFLVGE